ncbi:MAG: rod shape-determining protein MreB [Planctomycetes bacterium SM23_65]|nr:MAG: rod shape-determining protein MreB [Planctomycetes bacterium SM23_65]
MIWDNILGWFSTDMGIDLGTATTLVCVQGRGIVLNEPSVVAVKKGTNRVLLDGQAVGHEAKAMLGKTPGSIQAIRPLKDGVIADFEVTEAMLRYFISKVHKRTWGYKPRVVIAIPSGITTVEKRAVRNSAERAGARKVFLIEEPRAAGIGVGLPVEEPTASMILDIGGGTTEVAVLSLGDIVTSTSIRVAGDEMDEAITNHMKRTYNLLIGEQTSERIKIEIGSAYQLETELTMEVRGRDLIAGLPRRAVVNSEEIREALREPIDAILQAVVQTLEQTEPELAADLVSNGMVLCGGGALLRGIDKVIAEETGLPTRIAEDPISSVAHGTSLFLEKLDFWKRYLEGDDETT